MHVSEKGQLTLLLSLACLFACGGDSDGGQDQGDTTGTSDSGTTPSGGDDDGGTTSTGADETGTGDGGTTETGDGTDSGTTSNTTPESCFDGFEPRAFDPSGGTAEYDAVAGDFEVDAIRGPWKLSEEWTGCDNYVFVIHQPGSSGQQLLSSPIEKLVDDSPENTHYFIVSSRTGDPEANENDVSFYGAKIEEYLQTRDQATYDYWSPRFHYVKDSMTDGLGWLSELFGQYPNINALAIDRYQRVRETHNIAYYNGSWIPFTEHTRYWSKYFNYEHARDRALEEEADALVVSFVEDEDIPTGETRTLSLPDAATLAQYDHLEIDITAGCPDPGHPFGTACGEWDYMGHLWLCDEQDVCETELFRWITPYSSPGHWVQDLTPMLPRLAAGGDFQVKVSGSYTYKYTIDFRFSDREDELTPTQIEVVYPFSVPAFDAGYSDNFAPHVFTPPPGVAKVELHASISGHGASNPGNCAEFCTHDHVVDINGTQFTKQYEMQGSNPYGCADLVEEGVVPNQGGTWFFDRAGWCPGFPVRPWVVDITDAVDLQGENTLTYSATWQGGDPPGDGAHIRIEMNLVYWE